VVGILDAADDGFSLWNASPLSASSWSLIYGYLYLANRRSLRS
jgi:hypothetical protein